MIRRGCAKFLTLCPNFSTSSEGRFRCAAIPLRTRGLVDRFSAELDPQLPSCFSSRSRFAFAAERTDQDHGNCYDKAKSSVSATALREPHGASQFSAGGF